MDEIDVKLKVDKEISEILYHSVLSQRFIEIDYKIFQLYIKSIEAGQIDFKNLNELSNIMENNVLKCIEYCKYLRKQYKEDKLDTDGVWDLWNKYIQKITKSLLTELTDEQCNKFKEYQEDR